jgi:hypothetical protein
MSISKLIARSASIETSPPKSSLSFFGRSGFDLGYALFKSTAPFHERSMTFADPRSASPVSVRMPLPRAIICRGESASALLDASSGESACTVSSYQ